MTETRGWIALIGLLVFCFGALYALWAFDYGPGPALGMVAIMIPVSFVVVGAVTLFINWAFGEFK